MKLSAVAPLLALPGTLGLAIRDNTAQITFTGAADAQFTQDFPADGSIVKITNPLSISHISSNSPDIACTFNGIDHSATTVIGVATVDVGPPQTQIQGSCTAGSTPPSPPIESAPSGDQVMITFIGAANAQFSRVFSLDGAAMEIGDPLSISHVMSNTEGVKCTFNGVDNSVTVVEGAQTVDVGPPQTQISGSCVAG
ncbi:hypothetical protein ASPVEDRAFT_30003 [Aspergillus versicolor CBS 583.65]|uniref:Ubiquitin 3 binding protein But2 C-terminal domain-containing protein n=1 Tax=Aspergillus versicolor CBS 583.65 TaxID=1036611 RepID=A0A1L9PPN9_ASPVE|nr:uncharacterized protein ASPVEDRAFT_30003 [Aspergillus versicolor CBS 583.65]OJJ03489.1 hypothetical protein ASPVEDRAFT_30003 [Aspergillus versicolor CBS 583.65]